MSKKYQQEIEEILKQAGEIVPSGRSRKSPDSIWRLMRLYIGQSLWGKGWSISPGRIMLTAGCLLVAALIVRAMVPGLAAPLGVAGLLLGVVGYAMFFIKPPKIEKKWRGQSLELPRESWWDRFRRKQR